MKQTKTWPGTIILGGIPYTLAFETTIIDDGISLLGQINYTEQTIRIRSSLPPQTAALTIIHEVVHGLLTQLGFRDHDEQFIEQLSYALSGLLYANPHLLGKLGEVFTPLGQ